MATCERFELPTLWFEARRSDSAELTRRGRGSVTRTRLSGFGDPRIAPEYLIPVGIRQELSHPPDYQGGALPAVSTARRVHGEVVDLDGQKVKAY